MSPTSFLNTEIPGPRGTVRLTSNSIQNLHFFKGLNWIPTPSVFGPSSARLCGDVDAVDSVNAQNPERENKRQHGRGEEAEAEASVA